MQRQPLQLRDLLVLVDGEVVAAVEAADGGEVEGLESEAGAGVEAEVEVEVDSQCRNSRTRCVAINILCRKYISCPATKRTFPCYFSVDMDAGNGSNERSQSSCKRRDRSSKRGID